VVARAAPANLAFSLLALQFVLGPVPLMAQALPAIPREAPADKELLAQLPAADRRRISEERNPRDRIRLWLDAATSQLEEAEGADTGAEAIAHVRLYHLTVLAANRTLRDPGTGLRPRDKLFKIFEKQLNSQLGPLLAVVETLPEQYVDEGIAIREDVRRVRVAALNSALDIEGVLGTSP
jgi:hypothetical protein